jgi:hypothetical protein
MGKITSDLLIELGKGEGLFKVSIRPKSSERLDDLVSVTRYKGMSSERIRLITEETKRLLVPICSCLESYGLVQGKTYVPDEVIRNVSALLNKNQIECLADQEYVGQISPNFQKNLPF